MGILVLKARWKHLAVAFETDSVVCIHVHGHELNVGIDRRGGHA